MKTNKAKLIAFFLSILLLISFFVSSFFVPKISAFALENELEFGCEIETPTYAKAMVVMESESGRVLFQKNCNMQLPMASITKIMTALVALKHNNNIDEKFKVDNKSVGIEGTSLYLRSGEEKTLRELLYGLMLPSGNDAAVAIACKTSGNEENFVKLMNEEAKILGLENTHFVNSHGLDVEGHYTSAFDLAKITIEAMKNETFREIVKTKNVTISGNEEVSAKLLKNKNKLLWEMEECEGVKTGFTDNAKRCFVSSTMKDGMRLVCVVLNCGPMFEEAKRLTNLAYEKFKLKTLLLPYSKQATVNVEEGVKDKVETFSVKKFVFPLTEEEFNDIDYRINLPQKLVAPVEKEQEIGTIEITYKGKIIFCEKIYTIEKIESTRFIDRVEKIVDYWNL